uniref:Uncharacterized protein n=1 Tax=Arundo donax TaxID=35708 RepID=A0A0A9CUF4_ARUDO
MITLHVLLFCTRCGVPQRSMFISSSLNRLVHIVFFPLWYKAPVFFMCCIETYFSHCSCAPNIYISYY